MKAADAVANAAQQFSVCAIAVTSYGGQHDKLFLSLDEEIRKVVVAQLKRRAQQARDEEIAKRKEEVRLLENMGPIVGESTDA